MLFQVCLLMHPSSKPITKKVAKKVTEKEVTFAFIVSSPAAHALSLTERACPQADHQEGHREGGNFLLHRFKSVRSCILPQIVDAPVPKPTTKKVTKKEVIFPYIVSSPSAHASSLR
jgi:hypothetical protein